MGRDWDC